MKTPFDNGLLPLDGILLTCSSHEDRCLGFGNKSGSWRPTKTIIFHYDDPNPQRELNHQLMIGQFHAGKESVDSLQFTEASAVMSLRENMASLRGSIRRNPIPSIVVDISVFTKRHLLMLLRWLDDEGFWEHITFVYSEPDDYEVSPFIPLSFGLSSFQEVPGFPACSNLSRPVHLVLFLGYEGDRALAAYEHVEPVRATLMIPNPPFKPSWAGRTETLNAELIAVNGSDRIRYIDGVDPESTRRALTEALEGADSTAFAGIVCPLGTKPQALGLYMFLRQTDDPPALVYASPLRHNHDFYSKGIGSTWILSQLPL